MQPKLGRSRFTKANKTGSHLAKNRQAGNTLAKLAEGSGYQVQHSHHLRSIAGQASFCQDSSSQFLPHYMKTKIQKVSLQRTSNTRSPNSSSSTADQVSGNIQGVTAMGSNKDSSPSHRQVGATDSTTPPAHDNPSDKSGGQTKSPISLDDVMRKLNSLTEAVGKIDGMARDIDSIAEDIKSIKALQDTTSKLTEDMSEVQEDVIQLRTSITGLEEREQEILSNQQMIAKEVIDLKNTSPGQSQKELEARLEFEILKLKAGQKTNNLILEGIKEVKSERDSDTYRQVRSFIEETLGLKYIEIDRARRLGRPRSSSAPPRPILISFTRHGDRMEVWHARSSLNNHPDGHFILKEDLPAPLRPIMATLNRAAQTARLYPEKYHNVGVRDFTLYINGKGYEPHQLENLSKDLKPSYTSTPGNIQVVVFFGKDSRFSNHYKSEFIAEDLKFASMEQYLAHHRARYADRMDLSEKAMASEDPIEAKRILNELRGASGQEEWEKGRRDVLFAGLLAKFMQNDDLRAYLLSSENGILGEASKNYT